MKRFVIEGFNHFIKEVRIEDIYNEKEDLRSEKLNRLEKCRNAYICGLISEREALRIMCEV